MLLLSAASQAEALMNIIYRGENILVRLCHSVLYLSGIHASSYLLKPFGAPWREGIIALEAGITCALFAILARR